MSGGESKLPENNLPENSNDTELNDEDLEQVAGGAQQDHFLTLDGIKGESQDDKHKGEIQIESWSYKKK